MKRLIFIIIAFISISASAQTYTTYTRPIAGKIINPVVSSDLIPGYSYLNINFYKDGNAINTSNVWTNDVSAGKDFYGQPNTLYGINSTVAIKYTALTKDVSVMMIGQLNDLFRTPTFSLNFNSSGVMSLVSANIVSMPTITQPSIGNFVGVKRLTDENSGTEFSSDFILQYMNSSGTVLNSFPFTVKYSGNVSNSVPEFYIKQGVTNEISYPQKIN